MNLSPWDGTVTATCPPQHAPTQQLAMDDAAAGNEPSTLPLGAKELARLLYIYRTETLRQVGSARDNHFLALLEGRQHVCQEWGRCARPH